MTPSGFVVSVVVVVETERGLERVVLDAPDAEFFVWDIYAPTPRDDARLCALDVPSPSRLCASRVALCRAVESTTASRATCGACAWEIFTLQAKRGQTMSQIETRAQTKQELAQALRALAKIIARGDTDCLELAVRIERGDLSAGDVSAEYVGKEARALMRRVGNQSLCRGCSAIVYFVPMRGGRIAPYDGTAVSHFATCPNAEQFKGKAKQARA